MYSQRLFDFYRQMRHRQQSLQHEETSTNISNNGNYQQPRLTASALARMQQFQQSSEPSITSSSTTRSLYDVKAMQKEAVLSYVKVTLKNKTENVQFGRRTCENYSYGNLVVPLILLPFKMSCYVYYTDLVIPIDTLTVIKDQVCTSKLQLWSHVI